MLDWAFVHLRWPIMLDFSFMEEICYLFIPSRELMHIRWFCYPPMMIKTQTKNLRIRDSPMNTGARGIRLEGFVIETCVYLLFVYLFCKLFFLKKKRIFLKKFQNISKIQNKKNFQKKKSFAFHAYISLIFIFKFIFYNRKSLMFGGKLRAI